MKSTDVGLAMIALAFLLFGAGGFIVAWKFTFRSSKPKRRPTPVAQTRQFSRTQLEDLLRRVGDETTLLRRVDPAALPRQRQADSGRRWLR